MPGPLVSIAIPVYNEERFLRETLDSLLAQDYRDIEFIVSDNVSTDGTWALVEAYASRDSRIRLYRQETNIGAVANGTFVVGCATGKYVMFGAGHDLWHPSFVSECVAVLEADPSVVMAYSQSAWIDVNGNRLGKVPTDLDTRGMDAMSRFNVVLWGVGYSHQAYGLFRREVLDRPGLGTKVLAPDNLFLAGAALDGAFAQVPRELFSMRRLDDFGSWQSYVAKIFSKPLAETGRSASALYFEMVEAYCRLIESRIAPGAARDALIASAATCLYTKFANILQGVGASAGENIAAVVGELQRVLGQAATPLRGLAKRGSGPGAIVVDAVFFQMFKTGIARVWRSLLAEWAGSEFASRIVVLDRANSAPRYEGLRYVDVPPFDYAKTDADRQVLQQVCDREGAVLFVSTYYTTPLTTPSVFMAYDMIPEVAGTDIVGNPMWREKHAAIRHAGRFIAISQNTANDLRRFFPHIGPERVAVAHCGVSFRSPGDEAVAGFKARHGIERPYFLMVGGRDGYKNGALAFAAFAALGEERAGLAFVCTGPSRGLEPEFAACLGPGVVHMLDLSDEDLQAAYAGAVALVYPSLYEGFGMPIVEAMACGCPAITTRAGSIPEVAGDAAVFIDPRDAEGLARVMRDVRRPEVREPLIERGIARAALFSWSRMADEVKQALLIAAAQGAPGPAASAMPAQPPGPVTMDIADALALGLQFHQAGRLDEAENIYRQILGAAPATFDALHMLGVARLQRNDPRQAEPLIRQALVVNDGSADAHYNLGCVLKALGRTAEANAEFERTLELKPDPDVARRTLAQLGVAAAG